MPVHTFLHCILPVTFAAFMLAGCGTTSPTSSTGNTSSPVSDFIQSEDCTIGVGAQA